MPPPVDVTLSYRARQLEYCPSCPEQLHLFARLIDRRGANGRGFTVSRLLASAVSVVTATGCSFLASAECVATQTDDMLCSVGITRSTARVDPRSVACSPTWTPTTSTNYSPPTTGQQPATTTPTAGSSPWTAAPSTVREPATSAHRTCSPAWTALDHTAVIVLGQLAVNAKSNEIPAVRNLLAGFKLVGVVVTVDAMHTQNDTADSSSPQLTNRWRQAGITCSPSRTTGPPSTPRASPPRTKVANYRGTETCHGLQVTRSITVLTVPGWITFPGAAQVAKIRRTVTRAGKNGRRSGLRDDVGRPRRGVVCSAGRVGSNASGIENRLPWLDRHRRWART